MFPGRRLHGIELLDIARCPRVVRDGALDYLQFVIRSTRAYSPIVPILAAALKAREIRDIVDVCSGGGGPWPDLRTDLVNAGAAAELHVTLTDLFPNIQAFAQIVSRDPFVTGHATPHNIEQHNVPLSGMRTIFSSFHHFSPPVAARVLRNVLSTRQPIFIAEITQRRVSAMLWMLLAPLLVWLATPQLRPFTWSRIFFTYLVPAIPLVVCFDGIVSCFRTYSEAELRELFRSVDDLQYEWQLGRVQGRGPLPVTFALGFPRTRTD